MPGLYNRGLAFQKVLVANRGEIAIRVMRTLREMGIASVAIYTPVDRATLHIRKADEAVAIPGYLDIDAIVAAALGVGADAIHPGYGFLSENPRFAQTVTDAGLNFIGPSAESITLMGSKTGARKIAKAAGTPVIPGTEEGLLDAAEALAFSKKAGFPVMLKAVSGGGGKGMRRVDRETDLVSSFEMASGEALQAFGDGRVYVEKLIERARHIEIQVLGDRHGNLIHLGERECSLQRRHQKVIEECPSPLMAKIPGLRDRMGAAALKAARAAGYYNVGTVEFLADDAGNYYFLEMNTRLQVEHAVTEMVTGLDLVRLQIEIAQGAPLPLTQADVTWTGSAIECRIYAEDPANNFFPSPGRITHLAEPSGPGIRVDSTLYRGWTVPIDYDPILAKLIAWAGTREHARLRLLRALAEFQLVGIQSNVWFFEKLLNEPDFISNNLHTSYLDEKIALNGAFTRRREPLLEKVAATVLASQRPITKQSQFVPAVSKWRG